MKTDDIVIWKGPNKPNPMKASDSKFGRDIAAIRLHTRQGQKWSGVVVEVFDEESGLKVGQKVAPNADKLFAAPEPESIEEVED